MNDTWIDKWSRMDARTTAHWWLGNEGTVCGLDFRSHIERAYADDPRCQKCAAHPAAAPRPAELTTTIPEETP